MDYQKLQFIGLEYSIMDDRADWHAVVIDGMLELTKAEAAEYLSEVEYHDLCAAANEYGFQQWVDQEETVRSVRRYFLES